jgi:basic amino acid/polyamine antiporter, APA family
LSADLPIGSQGRGAGEPSAALVRGLGLFDATALIVGSVIGSGIFVAPSLMAGLVESSWLLLGLWAVGGLLTLAGALCYAELAAAFPRAGGQYVYLREAFGPIWGFLYGWTLLAAINTGFVAAVAVAFAKYLGVFFPWIGEGTVVVSAAGIEVTSAQLVALGVIALLTALNIRGLRAGAAVQNVFTVAKVGGILALVLLALGTRRGAMANFAAGSSLELGPAATAVGMGLLAAVAVAMSKALFAYDAWFSVTFAAEEVREPERNLPRALILGTLAIMAVYCSAVAVYLYMVPIGQMFEVKDNRIAAEAALRMIGAPGAALIALVILVSTFGCVNGLILSGARVVYAMARDGLFFRGAARVHPVYRTPSRSLALQGLVAGALTLTGTFSDLLTMTAFSSLLFNALTIVGLFTLRSSRPDLVRPYRTWGYPWVPLAYVAVSAFFLVFIVVGDLRNSGLGLALTAAGLPAYAYWARSTGSTAGVRRG